MADATTLAACMALPPKEAIAMLRKKGFKISFDWEEVWQDAHAQAFTVAKVGRLDILQDIRDAVTEAVESGQSFRWFEKELAPVLQRKGWWGRKTVTAPNGEERSVQLGSPWRLWTIYRTNLQTAYQAGRYQQQLANADDRPYGRYVAVMDAQTRPEHRSLHGTVAPIDGDFFRSYYPPNDFGCRCRVQAMTRVEAEAAGVTDTQGRLGTAKKLVSRRTGELREVATFRTRDPLTGRDTVISPGVGWSYNPGATGAWSASAARYTGDLGALAERELAP
ncbi:phage head morphogenesis protein [Lysobacter sp. CA196]|uniref:phage head morphogenesis protein n=1 Tax=Lysobacter sp. CA196 TaxID=3455606 RepID=UPI003F8D53A2